MWEVTADGWKPLEEILFTDISKVNTEVSFFSYIKIIVSKKSSEKCSKKQKPVDN
jgi:hypothetical protein